MDTWLKQTPYSDPGGLDTGVLPREPGELARLVRGLIIHRGEGEPLGYGIPPERLHHVLRRRLPRGSLDHRVPPAGRDLAAGRPAGRASGARPGLRSAGCAAEP